MHSKQINVYLTAVDQVELVKQLQATGEFVVVHSLAELWGKVGDGMRG